MPNLRALIKLGLEKARTPAAIYLMAGTLGRVGSFFLIPLYTRRLTPAEYGTYALFISVLGLLPSIFSLGLGAGLPKAYFDAKDDEKGSRAYAAVARGLFGIALVWSMVGVIGATVLPERFLAPLSHWHALLLVAAGFGSAATTAGETYFRIREKAIWASMFPLAGFAITAGLGIGLVVFARRGLDGAVEAPAIAAIVVGLGSVGFVFIRLSSDPIYAITKRSLLFSIPFVAHYVAWWVQSAGDRWVISLSTGDNSIVGRYYLAVQLMSPVSMVVQAWNQGVWPPMGRVYRDEGLGPLKAQLWSYQKRAVLLSTVTAVGIHVCLPLLSIVIGPRFLSALTLMPWLGVILIFDSLYFPAQNIIYYAGRTKWIPLIASTTTFGGLAISGVLVPHFGVKGLIIGRFIGSFVAMITFSLVAHRVTDAGDREATAPATS